LNKYKDSRRLQTVSKKEGTLQNVTLKGFFSLDEGFGQPGPFLQMLVRLTGPAFWRIEGYGPTAGDGSRNKARYL